MTPTHRPISFRKASKGSAGVAIPAGNDLRISAERCLPTWNTFNDYEMAAPFLWCLYSLPARLTLFSYGHLPFDELATSCRAIKNHIADAEINLRRDWAHPPGERTRVSKIGSRHERPHGVSPDRARNAIIWKRSRLMRAAQAHGIPILVSLALVSVATACLFVLKDFTRLDLVTLFYLLPVLFAATRWGIVPAVVAALAGAAAADFFFYPPLFSLSVHDPRHAIDIV